LDEDAGGFVIPMYIDNLRYFISEKSMKTSDYFLRYSIWWLYLVDYIGWGLGKYECEEILSSITDPGGFNRIYIISYGDEKLLASIST
jgi:hypothetical protein